MDKCHLDEMEHRSISKKINYTLNEFESSAINFQNENNDTEQIKTTTYFQYTSDIPEFQFWNYFLFILLFDFFVIGELPDPIANETGLIV